MEYLKVLEEDNIHVIIGVGGEENYDTDRSGAIYSELVRLANKHNKRRFTLHIVTDKPRPLYIENIRSLIQNNIVYSLTIRYHNLNFEELEKIINDLHAQNKLVYGVVEEEFAELVSFLKNKGIEVVKI
ncbi:hypothetical protein [Staphylothermus hellenicus]|uniref:Radical SAM domain protein n=1 Tax=Staphylothermus hellenicus (strain DSM 12710 / JCM 10830 / BK20S6-10-b1 / P8) TaxID=591019 RepID=D7D8E5_STAHD|nr:hypothetical protein [Staphylothermus hellenicus]ADI32041.1 hypothetical protein Shell_0935 [Staphylothermus hellenicus DSM 12710]